MIGQNCQEAAQKDLLHGLAVLAWPLELMREAMSSGSARVSELHGRFGGQEVRPERGYSWGGGLNLFLIWIPTGAQQKRKGD